MRATNTSEICIFNDDGAGGFADGDDWRGGCVIVEVNELRGTPRRLPLGREPACSDVVGDGLEGYGRGVVVVGVLAGDGVEEATIFKVDPSSISKRLADKIRSRAFVVQGQQTLT